MGGRRRRRKTLEVPLTRDRVACEKQLRERTAQRRRCDAALISIAYFFIVRPSPTLFDSDMSECGGGFDAP
jgi:hypothetical protein